MRTPHDRPAVEVDGLRQAYGDFEAVRGISFTVRPGELFALLGTNGAGKTTTMDVLEGLRPARQGDVRVLGLDPHRQRRRLRPRVGVMLQEGGFVGDLTVAETVRVWGGLSADVGRPPDGDVLETVGLAGKARTRVRQLSGGQKRRLDLALAVLSRPELLFLDEPTTGMDPEARRDTWDVIKGLRAAGTTVLLTTHYLEEAERLADHLAIMHEGTVHVRGTVDEVVAEAGDRIVFRLPRLPRGGPPSLLDTTAEIARSGDGAAVTYTLTGTSPAGRAHAALRPLLAWADEHRLTLHGLEIRKGTLEDVFLRVVGDAR
ncbi:ABC transporter ATP-binding protein [Sphaerisporangium sp. B11E5]|uniref:ABC transporter ATP-binding protein n=1 Tax=Sphaerisporangium sp. B11E5 TaxID=3153563 RepID=UPI00325F553A